MRLRYVGHKPLPRNLSTPIPFLAHSDRIGELVFNPECDVPKDEWAEFLLNECGNAFERVAVMTAPAPVVVVAVAPPKVEESEGRIFRGKPGKWHAIQHIKKHGLEGQVEIKRVVDGWQLVAVTDASVGHTQEPVTV